MRASQRLKELGLELPKPTPGKLLPAVQVGELVFTSGNTSPQKGKVGRDLTVEEAYQGAREAALRCLGAVEATIGSIDRVVRVVKLLGFVNCAEGFSNTPQVMHGATDLLVEIFGEEAGRHARSAIGVYQLPGDAAVEVELIVQVQAEVQPSLETMTA